MFIVIWFVFLLDKMLSINVLRKAIAGVSITLLVIIGFCFYVDPSASNLSNTLYCPVTDPRVNITNIAISQQKPETAIAGEFVLNIDTTYMMKEPENSYCVPKKIHFVWIGKEIPENYQANIITFVELNPLYEVILWTEIISIDVIENLPGVIVKDIFKEISEYTVKDLFDKEDNMGAKADIIRYEILYRNGGVYYDTDSICVKPLNDVLTHSFVSSRVDEYHNVNNSVFGFPKGSRFLEFVLRLLRWNILKDPNAWVPQKTGPVFFSGAFVNYDDSNINMISQHNLALAHTDISLSYQTHDASWM